MQRAQAVPERDAAAEHDRHLHDVQVVDETDGQELVDSGRAAAEPDIQLAGLVLGKLEHLGRCAADEVVGGVTGRERFLLVARHREAGCVERWVLAPPAALAILGPGAGGGPELVSPHDFCPDRRPPGGGDRLIRPSFPSGERPRHIRSFSNHSMNSCCACPKAASSDCIVMLLPMLLLLRAEWRVTATTRMHEQVAQQVQEQDVSETPYIHGVAEPGMRPADEIARLAQLRGKGVVNQAEFKTGKAKTLA